MPPRVMTHDQPSLKCKNKRVGKGGAADAESSSGLAKRPANHRRHHVCSCNSYWIVSMAVMTSFRFAIFLGRTAIEKLRLRALHSSSRWKADKTTNRISLKLSSQNQVENAKEAAPQESTKKGGESKDGNDRKEESTVKPNHEDALEIQILPDT